MNSKKISWITSDSFIDVDLPVIPNLSYSFIITWYVVINKSTNIDYKKLINSRVFSKNFYIKYIYLKHRARNLLIILEYINLLVALKKDNADIYYFDISGIPYLYPLVWIFLKRKKVIVAAHNVSIPRGAVNPVLAKLYIKFILSLFKNFHIFSESQMKIFKNTYPSKKSFLTVLALKDFGESQKNPGELITFLNFGNIREYKRLDILIDAANIVYEETQKKFIVKITGACENWNKYEKLIKYPFLFDLRIEHIPNEDVADIFSTSHYFILPYQDVAQSGALTVAFKYNIPVIASNIDSFKENIENNKSGFLFNALSVTSLVDVIKNILDNHKHFYNDLKHNQKIYVKRNYSDILIKEKYIAFFENFNL